MNINSFSEYFTKIIIEKKGLIVMTTIRDIAETVGVSPATVSGVLNNNPKLSVSDDTRKKILDAAVRLKYKKKIFQPQLKKIAFLYWVPEITELEDIYFKAIRLGVEKEIEKRNVEMVEISVEDGIETVPVDVEGIIAIGRFSTNELEVLREITRHIVFIDSSPNEEEFDSVKPDLRRITSNIINFFVEEGHSEIGMLGMFDVDPDSFDFIPDPREEAFRFEMSKNGLLNEKYIFIRERASLSEGYEGMLDAINTLGDDLPTAFYIGTDALALGALQALNESDIKVPDRVSIFSINDIEVAEYVSPPLTTYHIYRETLASVAFDLLHERLINGREVPMKVLVSSKPIFRKSTLGKK